VNFAAYALRCFAPVRETVSRKAAKKRKAKGAKEKDKD